MLGLSFSGTEISASYLVTNEIWKFGRVKGCRGGYEASASQEASLRDSCDAATVGGDLSFWHG